LTELYVWTSGDTAIDGPDYNALVDLAVEEVDELPSVTAEYYNKIVKMSGKMYICVPP
jgi:hypothetical protein